MVQVIIVVPTGYGSSNVLPSSLVPTGVPIGQLSVADAFGTFTMAEHNPGSLLTVIVASTTEITGAWLSVTITSCCTGSAGLPFTSVTFHVIVVVPTGYGSFIP